MGRICAGCLLLPRRVFAGAPDLVSAADPAVLPGTDITSPDIILAVK